jgi:hypothetical protein
MNYHDPHSAPRAGYDKALAFEICNRYGDGEASKKSWRSRTCRRQRFFSTGWLSTRN